MDEGWRARGPRAWHSHERMPPSLRHDFERVAADHLRAARRPASAEIERIMLRLQRAGGNADPHGGLASRRFRGNPAAAPDDRVHGRIPESDLVRREVVRLEPELES